MCHTFFISLSVLPGSLAAIADHLYTGRDNLLELLFLALLSLSLSLETVPVTEFFVQADDDVLFRCCEVSSLDVRSEIVQPAKSAALSAPG